MKIGTRVLVLNIAEPVYTDGYRKWERRESPHYEAWYVGFSYKQEGRYVPGYYSYFNESEQASLSVTKTIRLARLKFTERSNDVFAFFEDIKDINTVHTECPSCGSKFVECAECAAIFEMSSRKEEEPNEQEKG